MELADSEIAELATRGIVMMGKLKELFPEKSGEVKAWNFRKFHEIVHNPIFIVFFGWIKTTSCQSSESAAGCCGLAGSSESAATPLRAEMTKPIAGISRSTWQRFLPRNTQA
jgi:hypothetical protein